ALGIRIANYKAAVGSCHVFLWEKMQPLLMSLPEDERTLALTFQQDALSLASRQVRSAWHPTDFIA
ncbi:hypothetical protein JRQ81_017497, partial [Phrynocephalus forsythii]